MLLHNKNAVIYGGGGAIGGAVARACARECAKVFLAGRTLSKLEAVARDVDAAGGIAEVAQVDVLDENAVESRPNDVAKKAGSIDIALNAVGIPRSVWVCGNPQSTARAVQGKMRAKLGSPMAKEGEKSDDEAHDRDT
jgi:NAD(P)-dependent dehydrogenase (short-subunit alcohol dehydrogenase family)